MITFWLVCLSCRFMKVHTKIFSASWIVPFSLLMSLLPKSIDYMKKKINFADYWLQLVEKLLSQVTVPNYTTWGRQPHVDTLLQLQSKAGSIFQYIFMLKKRRRILREPAICAQHTREARQLLNAKSAWLPCTSHSAFRCTTHFKSNNQVRLHNP
jgi:hypothetical protein